MAVLKKGKFKEKGVLHLGGEARSAALPIEATAVPVRAIPRVDKPVSVAAVRDKAHELISVAQKDAAAVVQAAERKAVQIIEKAHAEGFAAGRQEGFAAMGEKIKEALGVINQAVIERKKIIADAEPEVLRLALKVAEQVIRSEVSLHKDVCSGIVADAISRVTDREQIVVRVNHEDVEQIKKTKPKLASVIDGVKNFSIIEDNTIDPGGCVIETALGYVDARIKTRLQAIAEAFEKVKSSGGTEKKD